MISYTITPASAGKGVILKINHPNARIRLCLQTQAEAIAWVHRWFGGGRCS